MNQAEITPIIRPRMLYEALADALRERIFRHELVPGEPVDEFRLASGYGVSRTPLREALKVLDSEGLVELKARQGCFVSRLDWPDVAQLFDILDLLEAFGVREAAKARAKIASGENFHRDLAAAAGNGYLPELVERLFAKLRLAFGPAFDGPEIQPPTAFRTALSRAIAAGDAEQALRLLGEQGAARRRKGQALFARVGQALAAKRQKKTRTRRVDDSLPGEAFRSGTI